MSVYALLVKMLTIISSIAFGVLTVIILKLIWHERKERNRRLIGRVRLSDKEIYDQFYADEAIQEIRLLAAWHDVARILGVNAGELRPMDTLDRLDTALLPPSDLDDLDDFIMLYRAADEQKTLRSIDDVVRFLSTSDLYVQRRLGRMKGE